MSKQSRARLIPLPPLPGNLPARPTSFIGRERELEEVQRLFATTRLLTLSGVGGVGKTRLALEVAAGLLARLPPSTAFLHPHSYPTGSGEEAGLTLREREVVALIARGDTNNQIARKLLIAPRTAETHIEHILGKLGFHSRAQVVAWAVRRGLDSDT